MTTEVSNEMINNVANVEASALNDNGNSNNNKRKLNTVIMMEEESSSDNEVVVVNKSPNRKTLSHSVSLTGIDILRLKGRDEYASEIPTKAINLCSASYGAKVLFATDEWFAKADNLLKDTPPEFDEDAYCEQGKVMDGWESRRRREEGHDWCLIQLGVPYWTSQAPLAQSSPQSRLQLVGIELDTAYFTGNHTPQISIDLASSVKNPLSTIEQLPNGVMRLLTGGRQGTGHSPTEVAQAQSAISNISFQEILPKTPLRPGVEATRYHYFPLDTPIDLSSSSDHKSNTWVKLNYFPDGGVARMKFWAVEVKDDETSEDEEQEGPSAKKVKTSNDIETVSLYMPITTGPICTVVPHTSTDEPLPSQLAIKEGLVEISSDQNGGKGVACSNKHYGEPWRLVQGSTLGKGMWDGWETARHSHRPSEIKQDPTTKLMDTPLQDWAILKMGSIPEGKTIQKIILDTRHFLGNYPESILLEGCVCDTKFPEDDVDEEEESFWKSSDSDSVKWFPLVSRTRMSPNAEHLFDSTKNKNQIQNASKPITHVRLSIYPDGGCSRVRVYM